MFDWIWDNKLWVASSIVFPIAIWLVNKWSRPRLRLKLSDGKYTTIKNPHTGFKFQWARADVNTRSRRMIKNCRTYITRIRFQELGSDSPAVEVIDSRIPIAWANSNLQLSCDITGQPVKALVYRFSGDGLDVLRDENLKTTKELCEKGTYWFHLQSEAENAKAGTAVFKVFFEKQGKIPEIEQERS